MGFSLAQEIAQITLNSSTKEEAVVAVLRLLSKEYYLISGSPANEAHKELLTKLDLFNTPIPSRVESMLSLRKIEHDMNMKVVSSSVQENYGSSATVIESKKVVYQNTRAEKVFVIKTPQGYLEDVWEHLSDEPTNYSFTSSIDQAYKFSTKPLDIKAPKYLYNIETGESINTLAAAADYLNGVLQPVEVTEVKIYSTDQTKGGKVNAVK